MKIVLAFLLCVGVATLGSAKPAAAEESDLWDAIKGLVAILPTEELKAWAKDTYANDEDAKELVKYFRGSHFANWDGYRWTLDSWLNFVGELDDGGVPTRDLLNAIRKFLGMTPIPENSLKNIQPLNLKHNQAATKVIRKIIALLDKPDIEWELSHLVVEVGKILKPHQEKIEEYLIEKIQNDASVQKLIGYIASEKFEQYIKDMQAKQEVLEFVQLLKEGNIPVEKIAKTLCDIFAWKDVCA